MDKIKEAQESLKEFIRRVCGPAFLEATVKAVDKGEYLAEVETDEGRIRFDCRLRALASGNQSMDILPKIGSRVVMAKLADDDYLVIACDEVDSWRVVTGGTTLEITADGAVFNGGDLGGLVKAKVLKAELDKTNAALQAIIQAFTTWIPVPSDGGAALKTGMQTALAGKVLGNYTNIENEKVKH